MSGSGSGEETWTIYVCPECGHESLTERACECKNRSPWVTMRHVEVVEASALVAERQVREKKSADAAEAARQASHWNTKYVAARERAEKAEEALEAADRLADSVVDWDSHVVLEGLAGKYRSARASLSAVPAQREEDER